jgi:acylphosphatase
MTGEADSRRNVSRETDGKKQRGQKMLHRRLCLTGRVQGVGMRWYAVTRAEKLGLDGWVRNSLDGSVDMEFQGEPAAVEKMTTLMRQGAPYSRVVGVDQTDLSVDRHLQGRGFIVLYDRRGW